MNDNTGMYFVHILCVIRIVYHTKCMHSIRLCAYDKYFSSFTQNNLTFILLCDRIIG